MIRHVVMFRFEPHVADADVTALAAALDALPDQVDAIVEYRHGRDLGLNPANFDYVVVGDFDSVAGFEAYRDHPVHQQFLTDHIAGSVAERVAVQYEI